MKAVFYSILFLLISTNLFGQFDFKADKYLSKKIDYEADTTTQKLYKTINLSYVDSIFKIEKDFDFEFRVSVNSIFLYPDEVFILTLKNNKWNGRFFIANKNIETDSNKLIEVKVDDSKLDQLWELLVFNNVLTLPDQKLIQVPTVIYKIDTTELGYGAGQAGSIRVNDGAIYSYKLSTNKARKQYYYHCPKLYLKQFENVREFYNAAMIILLIRKYLGLKAECC